MACRNKIERSTVQVAKPIAFRDWPSTKDYVKDIKKFNKLLHERVSHQWNTHSEAVQARQKALVSRTKNMLTRINTVEVDIFHQLGATYMARDALANQINQATQQLNGVGNPIVCAQLKNELASIDSKLKMMRLISYDFRVRLLDFMSKAHLNDDEKQTWEKKFNVVKLILVTGYVSGVAEGEEHTLVENYLETLRERFPLAEPERQLSYQAFISPEVLVDDAEEGTSTTNSNNMRELLSLAVPKEVDPSELLTDGVEAAYKATNKRVRQENRDDQHLASQSKRKRVARTYGNVQVFSHRGMVPVADSDAEDEDFEKDIDQPPPLPFTLRSKSVSKAKGQPVVDFETLKPQHLPLNTASSEHPMTTREEASQELKAAVDKIITSRQEQECAKAAATQQPSEKNIQDRFYKDTDMRPALENNECRPNVQHSAGIKKEEKNLDEMQAKKKHKRWEYRERRRQRNRSLLNQELDSFLAARQHNILTPTRDSSVDGINQAADASDDEKENWLGDGLLAMLEEEAYRLKQKL